MIYTLKEIKQFYGKMINIKLKDKEIQGFLCMYNIENKYIKNLTIEFNENLINILMDDIISIELVKTS